jgi:hypothetical protein
MRPLPSVDDQSVGIPVRTRDRWTQKALGAAPLAAAQGLRPLSGLEIERIARLLLTAPEVTLAVVQRLAVYTEML